MRVCAIPGVSELAHGCVLSSCAAPATKAGEFALAYGGKVERGRGRADPWADRPREGAGSRIQHLGWILTPGSGLIGPDLCCLDLHQ